MGEAHLDLLFQRSKQGLVALGSLVPRQRLVNAEMVINYMRLGRWMRDHGFNFKLSQRVKNRELCFDEVARAIGARPALLMEFGVHKGAGLRYWSGVLNHPDSRMLGFDSFEGLPATFSDNRSVDRKRFDLEGILPQFEDSRIALYKGWFDEVLPGFTPPPHEQLVISIDADLYSSTICVLRNLQEWIVPGTFLYFDELAYMGHEALAFEEFMADTGKKFEPFIAEWSLNRSVFRCIRG